jgi:hypothetical protein
MAVTKCEKAYLSSVMLRSEGNVSRAARLAGKERRSFQRLLRKYAINPIPYKHEGISRRGPASEPSILRELPEQFGTD